MSISSLVRSKVDTDLGKDTDRREPSKPLSDYISIVASYVPTEILAPYTMALAFFTGGTDADYIALSWFWVFLVLTPVFVWLLYAVRRKEEKKDVGSWTEWPWWQAFASSVAFVVWSAALPRSAFHRFDWYDPHVFAIILVLVAGLLPLVGKIVPGEIKPIVSRRTAPE